MMMYMTTVESWFGTLGFCWVLFLIGLFFQKKERNRRKHKASMELDKQRLKQLEQRLGQQLEPMKSEYDFSNGVRGKYAGKTGKVETSSRFLHKVKEMSNRQLLDANLDTVGHLRWEYDVLRKELEYRLAEWLIR